MTPRWWKEKRIKKTTPNLWAGLEENRGATFATSMTGIVSRLVREEKARQEERQEEEAR